MDRKEFARVIRAAGFTLFDPDYSAERNLEGRTHYFSANSRRFHGSREVFRRALFDGLILGAIESYSADPDRTRRLFRPVFFDLDGNAFSRCSLEHGLKTKRAAEIEFWRIVGTIDSVGITRDLLQRKTRRAAESIAEYSRVCSLQVETA